MSVITTVLIAQASQNAGTITTTTFTSPQIIPVPFFEAFCVMNAADIADTTLIIGLSLQIRDASLVWNTVAGSQWRGNSQTNKLGTTGLVPYVGWSATSVFGTLCRVVLTIPKTLTIGVTGQITI